MEVSSVKDEVNYYASYSRKSAAKIGFIICLAKENGLFVTKNKLFRLKSLHFVNFGSRAAHLILFSSFLNFYFMEYFYAEDVLKLSCMATLEKPLGKKVQLEVQIKVDDFKRVLTALMGETRHCQTDNDELTSSNKLLYFVSLCIERYAKRVGIDRSKSSLCKYRVTLKHLSAYVRQDYHAIDVQLSSVNAAFINGFIRYLTQQKHFATQTIRLYLSSLRHFCHQAMQEGILKDTSWQLVEMPKASRHHFALTKAELTRLKHLTLEGTKAHVRDLFLFASQTGLAYADLCALRLQHIERGEQDGWLTIYRQKTHQRTLVHLTSAVLQQLDLLPKHTSMADGWLIVPDNRTINRHLHQIGQSLNLSEPLHLHVARHTFATLLLQSGVSVETVSTMLGHAHISTTQRYAEVTKQKILQELEKGK